MNTIRIIGCGNLYRGDDAVGLLVVHRLQEMGIPAEEAGEDLTRMISRWQPEETVFIVDAATAELPPGTILRYLASDLAKMPSHIRFSSHGMDLAEVIGLAGALGKLPKELVIIGIVGSAFGIGERVTPPVRSALELVVGELGSRVRHAQEASLPAVTGIA